MPIQWYGICSKLLLQNLYIPCHYLYLFTTRFRQRQIYTTILGTKIPDYWSNASIFTPTSKHPNTHTHTHTHTSKQCAHKHFTNILSLLLNLQFSKIPVYVRKCRANCLVKFDRIGNHWTCISTPRYHTIKPSFNPTAANAGMKAYNEGWKLSSQNTHTSCLSFP